MHNVMAARSVGVGEERILMVPIEQTARATRNDGEWNCRRHGAQPRW